MNHPLLICAGLGRSGSTLQYNLARGILERNGPLADLGYTTEKDEIERAVAENDDRSACIIKTHAFYPVYDEWLGTKRIRLICCTRSFHEVCVSFMRAYNASFDYLMERDTIKKEIEQYVRFSSLTGAFMQRYESLVEDLPQAIRDLGGYLGVKFSALDVEELFSAYSIGSQIRRMEAYNKTLKSRSINLINGIFKAVNPTSRRPAGLILNRDPKSGLHWNHIATAGDSISVMDALSAAQIEAINGLIDSSPLCEKEKQERRLDPAGTAS